MKVVAYDSDDDKNLSNLSKHDKIGEARFMLSEVVNAIDQSAKFTIKHKKGDCTLIVNAEEKVNSPGQSIVLKLEANLNKKGLFFLIWKSIGSGYKPVYKSAGAAVQNNKQVWGEAVLVSDFLCNNDDNLQLRADLMEAHETGNHKLISSANFTLD